MNISAIEWYAPDTIPERMFVGYEEQQKAGIAIGNLVEGGEFKSVLVFGYSGTGKSAFPVFLTKRLNGDYDTKFSLALLRCQKILDEIVLRNHPLRALQRDLIDLSKKIQGRKAVLCLDEIDCVNYSINNSLIGESTIYELANVTLGHWIVDSLRHREKGILIFGVSDYPKSLETAIASNFDIQIYFEPTDLRIVEEIIRRYLQIDRSMQIASKLIQRLLDKKMNPISSEIVAACEYVKQKFPGDLNILTDQKILGVLMTYFCPCSATKRVNSYIREYSSLIHKSRDHTLPYLLSIYDKIKFAR